MTAPPPVVRGDLLERARDRVRDGLGLAAGDPVPADGLIRIFARLAEIAAARVDGALEKNRLAFLDLVGVRQAPPHAARVPLTFTAADGAPNAVRVPAGTAAAAAPAPGQDDPVLFQTEQELTVSGAALVAACVREPARDRVADLTADIVGPAGRTARDPFAGEQVPERRLLIGCGPVLALGPQQVVTLTPSIASADDSWLNAVTWAWWDGAAWRDIALKSGTPGKGVVLAVPEVPATELGGRPGRWLSGRLSTSVPHAGLAWDAKRKSRVTVFTTGLDAAYADAQPLDVTAPIAPFGPAATAAAFAIAAEDAFGKPGAVVTLVVRPTPGAGGAGDPPPALVWEYYNGRAWKEITAVADTTVALTAAGTVGFAAPDDWAPSDWPEGATDARTARWLRARLRAGAFVGAPRVEPIDVGVSWALPRIAAVAVRAKATSGTGGLPPDAALVSGVPADPSADFLPFGERPAPGATLAVASDEAVSPAPAGVTSTVSIAITLTPVTRSATPSAVVAWEYWDAQARAWALLGESSAAGVSKASFNFTDGTKAFTVDGTVAFDVPGTLAATELGGEPHRWVRARLARGDYGKDAQYTSISATSFSFTASTLVPPSIATLRFAYTRETSAAVAADLIVQSDSALTAPAAGGFEPFPPMEAPDAALHLGFSAPLPNAALTLYAHADQAAGDGAQPAPAVAWEYWDGDQWARLAARDETRGLARAGIVTFVGPADIAPKQDFGTTAWWLRVRREPGPAAAVRARTLLTNTIWAAEGTAVAVETLGSSTGEPGLTLVATRTPVLDGEVVEVFEPDLPPAAELAALGDGAVAGQDAGGIWLRWQRVTDFVTSGPRDRHYTLDAVTGTVAFGDGRHGLVPPAARAAIRMRYRSGGGARGNRAAGEITELKTAVPYVEGVTNHEPAGGGSDVESLDSVRSRGPRILRHGGRAVAAVDVEDLATQSVPAVARTWAIAATGTENAGQVGVIVVPAAADSRPEPGAALLADVRSALAARLPATAELWVSGPGWMEVSVTATLAADAPEAAAEVQGAAAERLAAFLHPLTGGTGGSGWPFGRVPHESDLVAVLEALPRVDHVEHLSLAVGELQPPPAPGAFLITSGRHSITMAGG
jgi:hypothetical protein